MFDGLNDTRPLLSLRVIRLGREPTIHIQDGAIDEPAFLIGVARRHMEKISCTVRRSLAKRLQLV
jgi:hypothetical protein